MIKNFNENLSKNLVGGISKWKILAAVPECDPVGPVGKMEKDDRISFTVKAKE